ncbi:hypothetical protein ACTOJ1_001264 [Shigella flexneri]
MKTLKLLTLHNSDEIMPYMISLVVGVVEQEYGIKVMLENGDEVEFNNYDFYHLFEIDNESLEKSVIKKLSNFYDFMDEKVK